MSYVVSTPFPTPPFTPGVRSMAVPEIKRLKSLEEENARRLPKPCWIRRRFRWLWGESTDDRPEAGSRGVDV